ncbi:MAG: hypothetical protein A2014_09940, partial [Spirochaetes bacterium GWF1_49_6]
MDEFDRITVSPKYCSGQPSIRDTRITLSVILRILANGSSENDVLTAYPELEPEDIHQAKLIKEL